MLCKVEPMNRALKEKDSDCWINGRRRDHGAERASLPVWEDKKLNPISFWSFEDCWLYLRRNNVLYHPLHDIGYSSLGDSHSTDKVDHKLWFTYGGERSGRFKNLKNKDGSAKTECGIHVDKSNINTENINLNQEKIILYKPEDDPNIINVNRLNFMENVVNNDQNILVYAYSPYCKQCKAFEPEFKALSDKYKDNNNIIITRLNAYEEEILYADLSYQIQALGYPSLFLFISGNKSNPIEYGDDDKRDLKSISKFIENLTVNV
jgi:thiol-disulfide isomerase/thioredoxin